MAQVPECVVCLQPYDDFLHVPRVLACGHSFCELCLMQLQSAWQSSSSPASNNNDNNSPASAKGAMIRCPECSHRTRLPLGGQQALPKNVELLRLLPSLIREADSTSIGTDSGETSSASPLREPVRRDGNTNNKAAAVSGRRKGHHLNAADSGGGAGSRSSVYGRRPKAGEKGKQRFDSNSDSGSSGGGVNRSWLLPLDLYSENSDKISDIRAWILPEKAIKLRGGEEDSSSPRVTLVDNNQLFGEILLERERLSSSVPVRLRQLMEVSCAPHPQQDHETTSMSYEESSLKAWEGCHYEVKTELLLLLRVSLLTRGLCRFLGVWMNRQRNALFLVTQSESVEPNENISGWEMMKASFQHRELSPDFKPEIDKGQGYSGLDSDVSVSSAASDMTLPAESSKAALSGQGKFSSSAVVEQMRFSRLGLELCGTLCEVHSQGLIFGILSPNCFTLDQLGSLLIDLNAALNERSSLHDAITRLRNSSGKCNSEGGGVGGIVDSVPQNDFLKVENYRNSCWRYMSPEALSLLIPYENQITEENDASSSSSSDKLQNRLTCQTDVWSVGCLILELLSGKVPYEGVTFQEVLHKVLVEREKPGNFLNLLDSSADWAKNLAVLLSKCFEYDPDERPQLGRLCRDLMEFGLWSNVAPPTMRTGSTPPEKQHLQSEQATDSAANQKYWVLCLPGFVRGGYPDSWRLKVADVQESQRRLSLLMVDNGAAANDERELQPCGLEQKASFEGHQDYVTALAVCGDSLLSASFDKTIRVWSLEDRALQHTLQGHSSTVVALAVDHNASRCFSGDTGGTICVWDIGEDSPSNPLVTSWQEHDDWRYTGVASLAVSADGTLYSGSGDRTVKAWSLQNFNCLGIMEGHKGLVSSLLVDGELLYSGSWDGTIHVWWRSDQSLVAVLGGGTALNPSLGGVRALCMSDSFLFAGRDNGAIQVWRDEECLTTVKAHDMVVSTLYVEGDFLYTGSWDQQIKAWRLNEFLSDPSPTLVKKCSSALSSVVSDGDQLYAGLADRAIKVYSLLGDTWASLVQML